MKKETWIVLIVAAALGAMFLYPHFRAGYAAFRAKTGGRNRVVTGTANSGNDSGGVLTQAEGC